jgi:hypothetical protein
LHFLSDLREHPWKWLWIEGRKRKQISLGLHPAPVLAQSLQFFTDRPLEEQIAQWRAYLRRRQEIHGPDVEELEGHLRDQLVALTEVGLAGDEAFLVAVKRMGSLDALSREFARAHSERLWKQLVIAPDADESAKTSYTETLVVLGLAVAAALAIKVPALFGLRLSPDDALPPFYARNASLFVFPLLTVYVLFNHGVSNIADDGMITIPAGEWSAWRIIARAIAAAELGRYFFSGPTSNGLISFASQSATRSPKRDSRRRPAIRLGLKMPSEGYPSAFTACSISPFTRK